MGTRGYTQVIIDNKILVQQYGQWDHYPTFAGAYLVDFLKQPGNIEFLRNIGSFVSPTAANETTDRIHIQQYSWNYFDEEWGNISEFVDAQKRSIYETEKVTWDDPEVMRKIVANTVQEFGFDKASKYLLADRDIGFRIVDLIKALHELQPDAILETTIVDPKKMENPGEMICGVYTIELNANAHGESFQINWYDGVMKRPLTKLPGEKALHTFETKNR